MSDVEIFSIGDELLQGLVQDGNSHWMAKQIAARGARLTRTTLLPDTPQIVAEELQRSIARAPALVITQGGLGPTDDDRTREALALGLQRSVETNAGAAAIIRRRFAALAETGAVADARDSDSRMRMAELPVGARALDNQVGTAPGIVLTEDRTTVVALPGVPPELHWIWENPLRPTLDEVLGAGAAAELTFSIDWRDESSIALVLRLAAERHPDAYIKSRASGFGEDDRLRITLTARGTDPAGARALLDAALIDLRAALRAEGVPVPD